jgi:hypothetical protein
MLAKNQKNHFIKNYFQDEHEDKIREFIRSLLDIPEKVRFNKTKSMQIYIADGSDRQEHMATKSLS